MICPLCGITLKAVERQGLELDHCPQCQGFWLDQGELTELVRSEAMAAITQGQAVLELARNHREFDNRIHGLNALREKTFVIK